MIKFTLDTLSLRVRRHLSYSHLFICIIAGSFRLCFFLFLFGRKEGLETFYFLCKQSLIFLSVINLCLKNSLHSVRIFFHLLSSFLLLTTVHSQIWFTQRMLKNTNLVIEKGCIAFVFQVYYLSSHVSRVFFFLKTVHFQFFVEKN